MKKTEIKEFANTFHEIFIQEKVPRGNIKRLLYDRGLELKIQENTLDVIWNAFIENTYDPVGKNYSIKKSKETKDIMQGKKRQIVKVNKNLIIIKEYDTQAQAAKEIGISPSRMSILLKSGEAFQKHRLMYKDEIDNHEPIKLHDEILDKSIIRLSEDIEYKKRNKDPLSAKSLIKEAKRVEDAVKKRSSFEKAGDPIRDNPLIQNMSMKEIRSNQEPISDSQLIGLDDARQIYITALLDNAQNRILKYGIHLEEQEKQLFGEINYDDILEKINIKIADVL